MRLGLAALLHWFVCSTASFFRKAAATAAHDLRTDVELPYYSALRQHQHSQFGTVTAHEAQEHLKHATLQLPKHDLEFAATWGALVAGPCVLLSLAGIAYLCYASRTTPAAPRAFSRSSCSSDAARPSFDIALGTWVVLLCGVVDSCIVLRTASGQHRAHRVDALIFIGPTIGITAAVLLPCVLQAGAHAGRLIIGACLAVLTLACFTMSFASSFTALLAARAATGAAIAAMIISSMHVVLLLDEGPVSSWGMTSIFFGLLVSAIAGPWVVSQYHAHETDVLMAYAGLTAAITGCVHVASSVAMLDSAVFPTAQQPVVSIVEAVRHVRQSVPLWGLFGSIAVAAAVLSLHSEIVPLHPKELHGIRAAAELAQTEVLVGMFMGLAVLILGVVCPRLGEGAAEKALVIALVMSGLGLRALADGLGNTFFFNASAGLVGSHLGLCATLGFAPPVLFRSLRCCRGFPILPATAGVASSILTACWIAGGAVGVGLQFSPSFFSMYCYALRVCAALCVVLAFLVLASGSRLGASLSTQTNCQVLKASALIGRAR